MVAFNNGGVDWLANSFVNRVGLRLRLWLLINNSIRVCRLLHVWLLEVSIYVWSDVHLLVIWLAHRSVALSVHYLLGNHVLHLRLLYQDNLLLCVHGRLNLRKMLEHLFLSQVVYFENAVKVTTYYNITSKIAHI